MEKLQKGFILPLLLIIVASIGVGGGIYYHQKKAAKVVPETPALTPQPPSVKDQKYTNGSKRRAIKHPVALSFEAKAREAAQAGECGKQGSIGSAVKVQEQYEYALFNINNSSSVDLCSVDLYAKTVIALSTKPICDSNGENCHGTGLLPIPKKQYKTIPSAPDPSTLQ